MVNTTDNIRFQEITDETLMIYQVRSDILKLTHSYFGEKGFWLVDPPTLHEQIRNKKSEVYISSLNGMYSLSSSNALYMGAYAAIFGNVYTISTCFRDENDLVNHLIEFKMLEVEMLKCSFDELLDCVEFYIRFILEGISEKYSTTVLGIRVKHLLDTFKPLRVPYNEFIDEINKHTESVVDFGIDLSTIDTIVSQQIDRPIFIIDYPFPLATWTAKPKAKSIAYAFNLILPESFGELAEGCERNNDIDVLNYKFKCANIVNLEWYINATEKISTNRSGFGIGIDRLVRWIVDADDIRKTNLFSR